ILLVLIGILLAGCSQFGFNKHSTVNKIYKDSWDGHPVVVKQQFNDGKYDVINEITDETKVENLIGNFEKANWQENVEVDIRPPEYVLTWNSYTYHIWENEKLNRLEFNIVGEAGFGNLSKGSSEEVRDIFMN